MQNPYNMTAPALPPALASILSVGAPNAPMMAPNPGAGLSGGMAPPQQATFAPSYQAGGMIGPGGMPEPSGNVGLAPQGQMPQGPISPQMLEMELNRFASQRPQQMAEMRQAIEQGLQSGELTPQELNMMVQLATVAAQNPQMYPNVRRFAIQQGLATEQDLPEQYDQGLVFVLLLVGRAMQQVVGGAGGAPAAGGAMPTVTAAQTASGPVPSMARGGMTPDSKKADGSVLINAHEGEYVIPAHIVKAKGTEFFDKLIGKDAAK